MDLDLSPDHVLLRDTIREFMEAEVAPVVDQHERERESSQRDQSELRERVGTGRDRDGAHPGIERLALTVGHE